MPPAFYDVLVQLIEDEPESVNWMLGLAGVRHRGARCTAAELVSRPRWPRWPDPHDADAVIRLGFSDDSRRIVVCKALSEWSEQVYYSLPAVMSAAFEDHHLPVAALSVCRTDILARRYRRGIPVGPGSAFHVHAVGPSDFPDLVADAGPPTAPAAVASAVLLRGTRTGQDERFIAALQDRLAEFEPERAAAYAEGLLRVLAREPAALLRSLTRSVAPVR